MGAGRGSFSTNFVKASMKVNWNFQIGGGGGEGGGVKQKTLFWGEYEYFLEVHISWSTNKLTL